VLTDLEVRQELEPWGTVCPGMHVSVGRMRARDLAKI